MGRTGKYHHESGNKITKTYTWYVLTDKWILAQNLGIPKTQLTDEIKLKKKEGQNINTLILLGRWNKIPTEGDTKCGAESEGRTSQRLCHLVILPIYSYKTQTLL